MAGLRGRLSRLRAQAAFIRARRVLAQADHGRAHRPQRREDHVGARQRALCSRGGEGAWFVRQVSRRLAALRTRSASSMCSPSVAARLGGNTGQMLLRFLGYDAFVTSKDVVACLRDAGLDIAETPTSKRDLAKIFRSSSTPGRKRPACPTGICRSSAPCRSARTIRVTAMAATGATRTRVKTQCPFRATALGHSCPPKAARGLQDSIERSSLIVHAAVEG